MKDASRLGLVLVLIALTSALHYQTATDHLFLHALYQRFYYIPILLAAFWYGPLGGILAATLTSVSYGFHIQRDWAHNEAYSISQYAEIVLFYLVGLLIGGLASRQRREERKLKATTAELSQAYQELQKTSQQLRRSERLAAMGALTAGIAHEIRNPLGSIKGAVEIIDETIPGDHPQREFLEIIKEEVTRLNSTLTEFLRFGSIEMTRSEPASVNRLVQTTVKLLQKRAADSGVEMEVDLDDSLPEAKVDPDQLRQVLINVMLNGIQAMPSGGTLKVSTRFRAGTKQPVCIQVSDAGVGIDDADLERAFDPFFSTKPAGMGLGLSISHQMVLSHGGSLSLHNNRGPGLTASIELPLVPEPA